MGKLWDCSAPSWAELQPSGSTPLPFSTRETEARTERVAAQVTQASGSRARALSSKQTPSGRPEEIVLPQPHGALV